MQNASFQYCGSDGEQQKVEQFTAFWVCREEGLIGRFGRPPTYITSTSLEGSGTASPGDDLGWICWQALNDVPLTMINFGRQGNGPDPQVTHPWGIRTSCDAFLLKFDTAILGKRGLASLACMLDHAVQRYFHLSDSDLLLLDAFCCPLLARDQSGLALADAANRGFVPMAKLADQFREILEAGYQGLLACTCAEGCFRCLRTYATSRFAPLATRHDAATLLGAILGHRRWSPPVPASPFRANPLMDTVIACLNYRGDRVYWSVAGASGIVVNTEGEKAALQVAFHEVLDHISPGTPIAVGTNKGYFAQFLAGHGKQALDSAERRLLTRLLPYPPIQLGPCPPGQVPKGH